MGWEFWYISSLTCGRSKSVKFHGGWKIGLILTLWRLQVSLKFHGGGNFDVILTLWRVQVSSYAIWPKSCAILAVSTVEVVAQSDQRVAQSWELRNLSKVVAQSDARVAQSWELRNLSTVVAQSDQRVAQSFELRNLSKVVAQAELRNPRSCASRVAQSCMGVAQP